MNNYNHDYNYNRDDNYNHGNYNHDYNYIETTINNTNYSESPLSIFCHQHLLSIFTVNIFISM